MAKAAEAGRPVQGAKGITPLINLQHFNIIWGFTPDYMHCVLLGVARQMTEDWLSNVGEEYYIGAPQTVAVLDQRLCSIKPHSCMPRLPRSVSLRKYWKASEWQQWLLYFSLPCLEGLLPRQYLKHFALLVKGIALLLQDTVSLSDISVSTDCLVKFVVDMQFLYGEKNMTFNVHQLLHMAQSVLNQGPLWAHSCFAFESNIGQIKQLVTSAKGAPLQIVERLMMASNFRYLKASASPCTLKFLTKAGPSNSKGGLLLSKPRAVSDQLLHLVQDHVGNIVRGRVMEHDRVIVSPGVRFHSSGIENFAPQKVVHLGSERARKVLFYQVGGYVQCLHSLRLVYLQIFPLIRGYEALERTRFVVPQLRTQSGWTSDFCSLVLRFSYSCL
ncbi:hypothetical protein HPB51_004315 [Rhipicephalus microplus]|uniref:Uncharacterized protein n=1 Tax=Rhipicephalus microplus TaxID=6941 RepID=A0A9J6EL54_RHIMP|nr:hypothetical protein HPB51_004315 [Rhipicephalus microplus]